MSFLPDRLVGSIFSRYIFFIPKAFRTKNGGRQTSDVTETKKQKTRKKKNTNPYPLALGVFITDEDFLDSIKVFRMAFSWTILCSSKTCHANIDATNATKAQSWKNTKYNAGRCNKCKLQSQGLVSPVSISRSPVGQHTGAETKHPTVENYGAQQNFHSSWPYDSIATTDVFYFACHRKFISRRTIQCLLWTSISGLRMF